MIKELSTEINEKDTEIAFSLQSGHFDELFRENRIIQYKRKRVREHLLKYSKPNSSILELNSGTGEDAIFLAEAGHFVHATDLSSGMQTELKNKVEKSGLNKMISAELCSFTQLDSLKNRGPYDYIFSNFGGLNCTPDLDKVLDSFSGLLKPGGIVTLVIIPKFCLWELLLIFKGKFKTATRRWFSKNGVKAHIEGAYFNCWYYNPSYIIKQLKHSFDILDLEGLCTMIPPSYMENFPKNNPRIYHFLEEKEEIFKSRSPWKYWGDYFIISFKKK